MTQSQRRVDSVHSLVLVVDLVRALFVAVYNGDDGGGGGEQAVRYPGRDGPRHCNFVMVRTS